MFVLAPGGVVSNMCASDPGNFHVVLRACNGSNWQRWIPQLGHHSHLDEPRHTQVLDGRSSRSAAGDDAARDPGARHLSVVEFQPFSPWTWPPRWGGGPGPTADRTPIGGVAGRRDGLNRLKTEVTDRRTRCPWRRRTQHRHRWRVVRTTDARQEKHDAAHQEDALHDGHRGGLTAAAITGCSSSSTTTVKVTATPTSTPTHTPTAHQPTHSPVVPPPLTPTASKSS